MKVLILGAGGHGQTVADALLRIARTDPEYRVVGFLDDTSERSDWEYQGIAVLGPIERISQIAHDGAIVAIGDNRARRRIFLHLEAKGVKFVSVRHPSAVIALDAQIGHGCYVGANAVVGVACRIGKNTIVNGAGCIGHHNVVGDHVHLAPGVSTTKNVHIGEGVQVGVGVNFYPGCSVGDWSVVGGGSLVAHDIPDGVLAIGSPARATRSLRVDSPAKD